MTNEELIRDTIRKILQFEQDYGIIPNERNAPADELDNLIDRLRRAVREGG